MPTFQITGFESFGQKFRDRIKDMIEITNERSKGVAQEIANLAKEYCPEDTGQLVDSIEVVQAESGLKQGRDEGGRFSEEAIITYTVKAGGPNLPHTLAVHENPSKHDPPTWQGKKVNFRKGGSQFLARAFRDYEREFRTRVGKKIFALFLVGLLASGVVKAQDEPVEEPKIEANQQQIGVFAAVWCKVVSQKEQKNGDSEAENSDSETPEEPQNETESNNFRGCDAGFAASLAHYKRFHWVAVIGTSSIGTGFAWSVAKLGVNNRPMAVAIGVMANYDSKGIYSDSLALTLGATVSLRGVP